MHHEVHGMKIRAKEGQGVGKDGGLPGGEIHGGKGHAADGLVGAGGMCAICGMNQVRIQFRGMVDVEISKVLPAGRVVAGRTGGEFEVYK